MRSPTRNVLTLFAIAKELERRKAAETLDPIDITLLIGLPPAHYEQLHSRFEQYFLRRREAIDFEYNGKYYSIRISKVLSYPQAFAAAVTQYSTLKTYSVAYIIDIGGFTIDVLKLRNGRPDLAVVESFEKGGHHPLQQHYKQMQCALCPDLGGLRY